MDHNVDITLAVLKYHKHTIDRLQHLRVDPQGYVVLIFFTQLGELSTNVKGWIFGFKLSDKKDQVSKMEFLKLNNMQNLSISLLWST